MEKKEKEKTLKLLLLIPQYSVIAAPCSEFLSDNTLLCLFNFSIRS